MSHFVIVHGSKDLLAVLHKKKDLAAGPWHGKCTATKYTF